MHDEIKVISSTQTAKHLGVTGFIQQGWVDLRPRRYHADKLLMSALRVSYPGQFEGATAAKIFTGQPEAVEVNSQFSYPEYSSTQFFSLDIELFWRTIAVAEPASVLGVLGAPAEYRLSAASTHLIEAIKHMQPGVLDLPLGYLRRNLFPAVADYHQKYLLQEKPGRFFAMELEEKTLRELSRWFNDDKHSDPLHFPFKIGWCAGAIFVCDQPRRFTKPFKLVSNVFDTAAIKATLNGYGLLAEALEVDLVAHGSSFKTLEAVYCLGSSIEIAALIAKAFCDRGLDPESCHFPDLLYGHNEMGHALRFLADHRSGSRLLVSFGESAVVRSVFMLGQGE